MEELKPPKDDFSFLQETIKEKKNRYLTPKLLIRFSILGIVFGLFACTSFVVLKPFVESLVETEEPAITIPEDEYVTDNDSDSSSETTPTETLAITDFEDLYDQLYDVAGESIKSLVSIQNKVGVPGIDSSEIQVSSTGVQVATTSSELLILTPTHNLSDDDLIIRFHDDSEADATVKTKDSNLGFMVLSVDLKQIDNDSIHLATLGNSNAVKQGDIIVSIGNQFEYEEGLGYGIVSSTQNTLHIIDGVIDLISTDIPVSQTGTGVLINTQGEIIGILNTALTNLTTEATETTISAVAISCLKEPIENMSNGISNPYLGILGVEITEEIIASEGLPEGIYVQEVTIDSPAMSAGIRNGDIIYQINDTSVTTQQLYRSKLMDYLPGDLLTIQAKRLGNEGYVDISFEVLVGKSE